MMVFLVRWYFSLIAALIVFGRCAAADVSVEIGRSIFVVNEVEGQLGDAPPKRIAINDNIVFNEDITTAAEAKTAIEFRDGSTLEVGPGSVVRIDSFVFNPEEAVSRKALQVGRGVFRYVSAVATPDQSTQISTPGGTVAIRGSVISGIVDPETPTFVYVGEGNASFTNDAGSTDLQPGNAIAVPTRTTPPMRPNTMPPAIAAQALQAIARRLPPPATLSVRPKADDAWLQRAGAANLLPVSEQARRGGALTRGRPLPAAGASPIAHELGLLTEGNRRNLFNGSQTTRTQEQEAFIAETRRAIPNAAALLARSTLEAGALHRSASLAGTALVIRGIAKAAPSAEVLTHVAAATIHANPAAATQISRYATETYRGPDRARAVAGIQQAAASAGRQVLPRATPSRTASARLPRPSANPVPLPPQRRAEPRATAAPPLGREPVAARERQGATSQRPPPQQARSRQPKKPYEKARGGPNRSAGQHP
jgi:hypothetical protein